MPKVKAKPAKLSPTMKCIVDFLQGEGAAIWTINWYAPPTYWLKGGTYEPHMERRLRKGTVNALINLGLIQYSPVSDGIHSGCYTLTPQHRK